MKTSKMLGIVTGALMMLATTARAADPQVNVGSANTTPGSTVGLGVTVGTTGAPVGGADFILKVAAGVTITSCDLTAIKNAGQDASYLDPADCSAGCSQVEVVIFSISDVKEITNGSTLVTCQFKTTTEGDFPVTAIAPPGASVVQLSDLTANPYTSPVVNNGNIHVEIPAGPTNTSTKTPTITPTPKVPTSTKTPTNTKAPTNSPTATKTPVTSTLDGDLTKEDVSGNVKLTNADAFPTGGGVVKIEGEYITYTGKNGNTLTGAVRGAYGSTPVFHASGTLVTLTTAPAQDKNNEDDDDCRIVAPGQTHVAWVLLIPAAILFLARRRAR